ncbi:hypothetical protein BDW02DRAFT_593693 [Decorospora gaudefroyi]|uniref:Uncharacterized protein n=1 Tax=Decorospora gaudefroyi TaxID=184978 RepID=A0A6A5KWI6_9PLEO|nr:hypothetical protein BDW02DRAFT_593693 [Decorospora gaudefroyi]
MAQDRLKCKVNIVLTTKIAFYMFAIVWINRKRLTPGSTLDIHRAPRYRDRDSAVNSGEIAGHLYQLVDVGGHRNSCGREKAPANTKREQWCRAVQEGWIAFCMSGITLDDFDRGDEVCKKELAPTELTLLYVR